MFQMKKPQLGRPGVWIYDYAALTVEKVAEEGGVIKNPYVGMITDYGTKTVIHEEYGDNFWTVMGLLQGWYMNWLSEQGIE